MILDNLEPKLVFKYFEEISNIPRGSGNEKEISDYIVSFAEKRNLEVIQDSLLNVIIKKSGTSGYENSPAVILQGHLDMVCEKNMDTEHDFLKDPIKLYVDGEFIKAKGTTLGADNGIAVAMAMAILDSDNLKHPPLEIVLTTGEEIGLVGALDIDGSLFKAKYMLNLDSEEEGVFLTSCAGGARIDFSLPVEKCKKTSSDIVVSIIVKGLLGGHSGMEINKGRGNSNIILARTLNNLIEKFDISLIDIFGGSLDNAIPREAKATISIKETDFNDLKSVLNNFYEDIKNEYIGIDDNIIILIQKEDNFDYVFTNQFTKKVISTLIALPNGVLEMSKDLPELVETSCNLGVISTSESLVNITVSVRSSVSSRKELIIEKIRSVAYLSGVGISIRGNYPGWEYNPKSELRPIVKKCYEDLFNKECKFDAVHAGLECGIFADKIKGLDILSFGPNMLHVHNPDECLEIKSVENIYRLLLSILESLK